MQYIKLKESLKDFTVFSLRDIKGYYIFTDLQISENALFEIANKIYSPSYISFEMALSYYHLIPENVYSITSVSTRKTYRFQTSIGQISYRTVKPDLFFGYNLANCDNGRFKIASAEKAILDYFYINPNIKNETDFISLRINRDSFIEQIDIVRLNEFLERFAQKTLTKRINLFLEFIKNA